MNDIKQSVKSIDSLTIVLSEAEQGLECIYKCENHLFINSEYLYAHQVDSIIKSLTKLKLEYTSIVESAKQRITKIR